MSELLTLIVAGLEVGSLYALMALGLVLIYQTQSIVNFAHGELLMAGAFVGYVAFQPMSWPFPVALVLAVLSSTLLGAAIERVVVRPLVNHPHATLAMATVGVSVAIRGAARLPFGSDILTFPPIVSAAPIFIGSLVFSAQSVLTIVLAVSISVAVFLLIWKTRLGREIRATQQNYLGAKVVGINTGKIYSSSWAVASAIGGAAGVLAAPLTLLYPDMGATFLLKGFAAAVLGGFGSPLGAVVGGIAIGILEKLVGAYFSTYLIEISTYVIIIVVVFVRPQGLFGRGQIVRV
jgi:branched-chain amino acid transport system permease protein